MCFGGGASAPSPTPAPAPAPVPTPSETAPQQTAEQKANVIKNLRYGMASTIKSSPAGITGTGADLATPAASGQKKTLGS